MICRAGIPAHLSQSPSAKGIASARLCYIVTMSNQPTRAEALISGIIAAAATMSYFSLPILRYASPAFVLAFGLAVAVGVLVFVGENRTGGTLGWRLFSVLAVLVGIGGLLWHADTLLTASVSNDVRCDAIQKDMLSAQPRRSDDPDLFQALGCRPQGVGRVFAKPTKLEHAAGHSLLEGGRR
jgi:hypothetical protein